MANALAPIKTKGAMNYRTMEGARAFKRDAKSELFLLAVTNMVSEPAFYESGSKRDARFVYLIHKVVQDDPEWIARFVPWLRNTAQMRSASIQMAAEYVAAGGPSGRKVIASAIARGRRAGRDAGVLGNPTRSQLPSAGEAWCGRRGAAGVHRVRAR